MADPIAFIDLQAQRRRLGAPLEAAIKAAVEGGQWILGPQVAQFEKDIAAMGGRQACHRLRQRHRCAAPDPARLGHRSGRCGVRAGLHLRRHGRSGGAGRRLAGVRGCAARHLQHGSGQPGGRHRAGEEGRQAHAQGGDAGGSVRPAGRLSRAGADRPRAKASSCSATPPRALAVCWTASAPGAIGDAAATSFFPGQAAGLLRRRRRLLHQ